MPVPLIPTASSQFLHVWKNDVCENVRSFLDGRRGPVRVWDMHYACLFWFSSWQTFSIIVSLSGYCGYNTRRFLIVGNIQWKREARYLSVDTSLKRITICIPTAILLTFAYLSERTLYRPHSGHWSFALSIGIYFDGSCGQNSRYFSDRRKCLGRARNDIPFSRYVFASTTLINTATYPASTNLPSTLPRSRAATHPATTRIIYGHCKAVIGAQVLSDRHH